MTDDAHDPVPFVVLSAIADVLGMACLAVGMFRLARRVDNIPVGPERRPLWGEQEYEPKDGTSNPEAST